MKFYAKGESNAIIGLFDHPVYPFKDAPFYEILIGASGDTWTSIRTTGNAANSAILVNNPTGYLDPDKYTKFWLSWENHIISLGYGWDLQREVIFWYNGTENYPVNLIGLRSYIGTWVTWMYDVGM